MELGFWSWLHILLPVVVTLVPHHSSAANYSKNETDRLALLDFKHQISDDPNGVLKSWNDSQHHCYWEGVSCDARHRRVIILSLPGKSLLGAISPHIGNLSFLKSIQLGENRFHGEIPQGIGRLFRLMVLNLSRNAFGGEIPANLSHCSKLRNMNLGKNRLVGKIPTDLGSLKKLVFLRLYINNLTGEFPRSLGNLSSLSILSLAYNNLEGSLPNEIGLLRRLNGLSISINKFTGVVPSSLYNISSMTNLSLPDNFLSGNLPNDIGLELPNLQELAIAGNQFYGILPNSIANATKLEVLDFADNKFEGQVPTNLGNLPNLQWLSVGGNLMGRNANDDLDFLVSLTNCSSLKVLSFGMNDFGGQLPSSIGNLSLRLGRLHMRTNKISGTIPAGLVRLTNLYLLAMGNNLFSGAIPRDFHNLQSLQGLDLGGNMLFGEIPSIFCNITSLSELYLLNNNFEGTLPSCLGSCQSLKLLDISQNNLNGTISPALFAGSFSPSVLDLSHNSFTSSLPLEVGRLRNINSFNISYNKFSGQIPGMLGDCSNLEYLNMEKNFFQGTIPQKLASLKGIRHLDLSQNNLTGQIPIDLQGLIFLQYLNLSFNNIEGEVPRNGAFGNASLVNLDGNSKLCGGIPKLGLPSCQVHKKKNWKLLLTIVISIFSTLTLISSVSLFIYRRRYRENKSSTISTTEDRILRISYHELQRATAGFSPENLVGTGGFGVIYKGRLDQHGDKIVAVKVLNLRKSGASKSFIAECNALRNIRHRNLVSILTYCSSIDSKGHEFKALVYEFMENGSLDMWLHSETAEKNLNMLQRLNVAIDVASALQYLHNDCEITIVHCDLKPSNILLDNDLTAHVGDFGLARLLPKPTQGSSAEGGTNSSAFKGSIGYAAPEYAMGCEASTEGDVYSYGILLLEIFTGRRPTNNAFSGDLNLHNYVKTNLPERVMDISDPLLFPREAEEDREVEESNQSIISILKIGLKCSEASPNCRIRMNEVTRQLQVIRDACLHGVRDTVVHEV